MRKTVLFEVSDVPKFKNLVLDWASQFYEAIWLDSNGHEDKYGLFDGLLAVDALTSIQTDSINAFENLKEYQASTRDWIFGYLSYDLKNDVEHLSSMNHDGLFFPDLFFFQPKKLIRIKGNQVEFIYLNFVSDEIEEDYKEISSGSIGVKCSSDYSNDIRIKMRIFKDEYFLKVDKMLQHIHRGDIYEANFCQEFYAENTKLDPIRTFKKLNEISEAPFATFLKLKDKYLISATPERYLQKQGSKIISQPIKGTAKRSSNSKEDNQLKDLLSKDTKERAENVMIVDLVRNDLSKSAKKGSVMVEELCMVYSYKQVHQMVSTVSSQVDSTKNVVDLIKDTFPMGSMTGAPKVSAMRIIEDLESFKRGLYSGAVGYFTPENDFDFNVVIRSILYNEAEQYVSYAVGGAITAKATPALEYEECLLKAKAMRQVLEDILKTSEDEN